MSFFRIRGFPKGHEILLRAVGQEASEGETRLVGFHDKIIQKVVGKGDFIDGVGPHRIKAVACVAGEDVSRSEAWKRFTGAYLDESFLIDYLTPREFFDLSRNLSAMPDAVFDESLQLCAPLLEGVPDALIRTLSAGNRQKVGLASAFLRRPQLVVLDEPFTFLDPSSQHTFKAFLSSYVQQHPSSIVLISSHDLHHVTDVSTRIALMEGGKIIRTFSSSAEALSQLKDYFSSRA